MLQLDSSWKSGEQHFFNLKVNCVSEYNVRMNFRSQRHPSFFTSENIRLPTTALDLFRCIHLLTLQFNQLTQHTLFFLNYLIITCTVLSNCVLIRYHGIMGLPVLMLTLSGSGGGAAFVLLSNIKFGDIHENSKKFISSYKRRVGGCPNKQDYQLLKKYAASYRTLKVNLGSIGYYYKPNTLRVLGKIVLYTTKFLLMTKSQA